MSIPTPLRILFLEDSEVDTQTILHQLYQGGYVPIYLQINNAEEMRLALQHNRWDIILCGSLGAGFSAADALQLLNTTQLNIPFIVLLNAVDEDIAVELMQAGASDYLFRGQLKRLIPAMARELREAKTRRAQQQAEASVLQLAAVIESMQDAIVSTDLQGRVLIWNRGAERLYGYSAAEVMGKSLAQLIQPLPPTLLALPIEHHSIQAIDCCQVTQQHKTGELIEVLLTVSQIQDAAGNETGFVIVARAVSECQLIQRMDALISVLNHELRTPLASLQAAVELLLTGKLGDLSQQGQRMLEIVANNTERLVRLTRNMFDLEELNAGEVLMLKQSCDIGEVIGRSVAKVQEMAIKRGVHLLVSQPSIQLLLDSGRIEQALHHLIMNAIQFSHQGGRIWLNVELKEDGQMDTCGPYVLIKIKDEGQGIPLDKLEMIFGRYQQVDTSDSRCPGGVGVGLAICRSIIQQHQGSLWVESMMGQGSTFYVALPMQRVAVPPRTGNTRGT